MICCSVFSQTGVGFMSKPESLEESHFFEAPGGEGMNFQRYDSQEVHKSNCRCISQPILRGLLEAGKTKRDSLLDNQVSTEAFFLGREKSSSEPKENLEERSDLPSSQLAKSKKPKYLCPECGGTFAYKSALSRHETCHTGEKAYPCVECNKKFSRSADLFNHERVHAGERLFVCSMCGKAYATRSNLSLHQNTHSGMKPYSCLKCGESFFWNSQLVVHSAKHT